VLVLGVVTLIGIEKVITFLVMLSILVVLHELGHFVLARRNGVRVNEFAVGFGPKIASWQSSRSGTVYSLRVLPLGGYCAMEGEDNKSSEAEQQREYRADSAEAGSDNFQAKSPWRRLAIVLAGPAANFILCYVILLISALTFGVASDKTNQPVVGDVSPRTPAQIAGIKPGDRIVKLDGATITSGSQLINTIHGSYGKRLDLVYERDGIKHEVYVTPGHCPAPIEKLACIGFVPVPVFERVGFIAAVRDASNEFASIADGTVDSIVLLVTHFAKYAPQIAGPIGMGQAAATVQDWGWGPYLYLGAMISFALGLFNLLPIPALDGGRAAFIIAELIRGKPVDPEKEAMVHIAGFAALMALMLLVAFHDLARIFSGNGVL
jgi:regulator of sigma E protease